MGILDGVPPTGFEPVTYGLEVKRHFMEFFK